MRTTERLGSSWSAARTICTIVVAGAVGLTGGCGDRDPDPPTHEAPEPIVAIEAPIVESVSTGNDRFHDEPPVWKALRAAAGITGPLNHDAIEGEDADRLRALARRLPPQPVPWTTGWSAPPSGHELLEPRIPEFGGVPAGHLPAPWPTLDDSPVVWCILEHRDGDATDLQILLLAPESQGGSWRLVRLHSWFLEDVNSPDLQSNGDWQALLLVHRDRPVACTDWAYLVWGKFEDWYGPDRPVLVIEESMGGTANPGSLTEVWALDHGTARLIVESPTGSSVLTMIDDATSPPTLTHIVWVYEGCGANDLSVGAVRAIDPSGVAAYGIPPTAPATPAPSSAEIDRLAATLDDCLGGHELGDVPLCWCSDPLAELLQWCFDGHPEAAWTAVRTMQTNDAWRDPVGTQLQSLLDGSEMYRDLPWADVRWVSP